MLNNYIWYTYSAFIGLLFLRSLIMDKKNLILPNIGVFFAYMFGTFTFHNNKPIDWQWSSISFSIISLPSHQFYHFLELYLIFWVRTKTFTLPVTSCVSFALDVSNKALKLSHICQYTSQNMYINFSRILKCVNVFLY